MTNEVKVLSDDALREIEARADGVVLGPQCVHLGPLIRGDIPALCATVRALRETLLALKNCQNKPVCGHCAALLRAATKEQP